MIRLQGELACAATVCRNSDYPTLATRCEQAAAEITRLQTVNAELVEACRGVLKYWSITGMNMPTNYLSIRPKLTSMIEAALAKAQAPAAGKVPTT